MQEKARLVARSVSQSFDQSGLGGKGEGATRNWLVIVPSVVRDFPNCVHSVLIPDKNGLSPEALEDLEETADSATVCGEATLDVSFKVGTHSRKHIIVDIRFNIRWGLCTVQARSKKRLRALSQENRVSLDVVVDVDEARLLSFKLDVDLGEVGVRNLNNELCWFSLCICQKRRCNRK